MLKKTVFLELPCELLDKIDRTNILGDRSAFVTEMLEKQLEQDTTKGIDASTEFTTTMSESKSTLGVTGEIDIINRDGVSLGRFNINTLEGFEDLARKIREVSEDPLVRTKALLWL
jgi:hypothetical protein